MSLVSVVGIRKSACCWVHAASVGKTGPYPEAGRTDDCGALLRSALHTRPRQENEHSDELHGCLWISPAYCRNLLGEGLEDGFATCLGLLEAMAPWQRADVLVQLRRCGYPHTLQPQSHLCRRHPPVRINCCPEPEERGEFSLAGETHSLRGRKINKSRYHVVFFMVIFGCHRSAPK